MFKSTVSGTTTAKSRKIALNFSKSSGAISDFTQHTKLFLFCSVSHKYVKSILSEFVLWLELRVPLFRHIYNIMILKCFLTHFSLSKAINITDGRKGGGIFGISVCLSGLE